MSVEVLKSVFGGETGIRTLDTLRYTRFPSVRLQPLGHLSAIVTDLLNLTYSAESVLVRTRVQSKISPPTSCIDLRYQPVTADK
jgi:hypothetical protein